MSITTRSTSNISRRRPLTDAQRSCQSLGRVSAFVSATIGLAAFLGLACSSATPAGEQWTASYVDPPDRVWAAINQTFDVLGYEIEEADRHNSIVVARSGAEDTDPPVALRVAQVAHTEVIRVHVTPHGDTPHDDRFDAAAGEFLATLDATIKGTPPGKESGEP